MGRQLVQCLCAAILAFGSYWLTTQFVCRNVVVDGESMNPTLKNAQSYLLNRAEYLFRSPQAGDIVVIRDPEDHGLSVKRIVAVAGETVELANGSVFVNGSQIREPYLPRGTKTFSYHRHNRFSREKFACKDSQYFVLGDNRWESADSRVYGPVPRQNILGIVVP